MTVRNVRRNELPIADLIIDAVYEGGRSGNAGDDPLWPLLGVSNQGGFRHLGKVDSPKLIVLTTSMNEPDWPDRLDGQTGLFTYYGDNRRPGTELHSTPRWGNRMLRDMFSRLHSQPARRDEIGPVLVFRIAGHYRDVRFVGLAVPGARGVSQIDDLIAVWRSIGDERFQNYQSVFTVLDVPIVSRTWLEEIRSGKLLTENSPEPWTLWVETGTYTPLKAEPIVLYRPKEEQLPQGIADVAILNSVYQFFSRDPFEFEKFAGRLCELLLAGVVQLDLTRPSRDGGRDGIGRYRIGKGAGSIEVGFALEAKCYSASNPVGVKAMSRLISRLRYRQFGVLVTTSYVGMQAYKEVQEDQHPIMIVSGIDIVRGLRAAGLRDAAAVENWLRVNF